MNKEITNKRIDYAQWYNDLVLKGQLADYSAVRGCMVIRPYGFALWENMQQALDRMFKDTNHVNAYFPLFIPKSFLAREAAHVEGFAKECAVVTHYRLKNAADGSGLIVDPEARLDEELIIRPTSETIIWNTYRDWIKSYRDLPLLINQWVNVVRWEMRTRLFLRTAEFLWQEGHTAHATSEEALFEARQMLDIYADFAENWMAMPVIKGTKTENERFAGAVETFCIESLMQDGKALQSGTSHFLGQNFAKAFDVTFTNEENKLDYVWATSWGVSTRLIGGLIMVHSDDDGLVFPPKLAPVQCVIVPIYKNDDEKNKVLQASEKIKMELKSAGISVKVDNDDTQKPGWKFAQHELKGIPVRIAIGPRDVEKGTVETARRDTREKQSVSVNGIADSVKNLLSAIQKNLFDRAKEHLENHITEVNDFTEFKNVLEEKTGFISAHWDGTTETELKIKDETKATIRCIPFNNPQENGKCVYSGKPSIQRVLFAKAY